LNEWLIKFVRFFCVPKVMPIPESSPANEPSDSISAMCQELSKGLTILSNNDDPFLSPTTVVSPTQSLNTATNSGNY